MAKTIALIAQRPLPQLEELLRAGIVAGCALALIFAGQPFPSGL